MSVNACYYRALSQSSPAFNILQLYDAGRVQRFHTTPDYSGTPRQSLAEHSWGVALLCIEICRRDGKKCSAELLRAALTHDLAEYWTMDCPAHVKWDNPELAEHLDRAQAKAECETGIVEDLSQYDRTVLKWADGIELYVYSRQRARAGVSSYQAVAENIMGHLGRKERKFIYEDRAFRLLLDLAEMLA
jgi:5'-deoxynucleotidase YfbR-like HD superfamily hydrolase